MRAKAILVITLLAIAPAITQGHPGTPHGGKEVVRGWLSDEGCAGAGRKRHVYGHKWRMRQTVHNEGKKIVWIDPDGKRVLNISNQDIVKQNIGDYVELTGKLATPGGAMRVVSLRFLDRNRAMCVVPNKTGRQTQESQNP
jgi:hypothetical protein